MTKKNIDIQDSSVSSYTAPFAYPNPECFKRYSGFFILYLTGSVTRGGIILSLPGDVCKAKRWLKG